NVAENAGGNKVIKYGATGRHVMGLEVVLPDGNIVQFGGKRVKDVTGYDFVNLMVGSEGTLGIITKIILRLVPLSKYLVDLLVPFKDVETAIAFVPKMITQAKLLPASIEFMDHASLTLTGRFLNSKLPYADAGAHLIIELEENDKEVLFDEYVRIGEMCLKNGALEVFVADNRNTREKIWKARKAIAEAVSSFYPEFCMEDIVVPINRIPQIMEKVGAISERYQLETINFGHAGDGNIHVTFLNDRYTPEQWEKTVEKALEDLYRETVLLGGTLSGEHGIGLKRKKYLSAVLSPAVLELTRRIKAAFDPTGILNPGKIAD
ncbi:MAG TPA: FAD-linked oxidase C-terminal domain-containing protein, partial [Thermotogota bacterium]|nr:FAD-linked oxidase C-terminal domain-containing protein [Thermotogota bacterium]